MEFASFLSTICSASVGIEIRSCDEHVEVLKNSNAMAVYQNMCMFHKQLDSVFRVGPGLFI